jgi:hypothetical protein
VDFSAKTDVHPVKMYGDLVCFPLKHMVIDVIPIKTYGELACFPLKHMVIDNQPKKVTNH